MLRSGLAILAVVLVACAAVHGAPALPPPVASRIDAIFAPFDHDGSPGYALGVVKDGQLVFAEGYGRANLDYNLPITPRTAFHLASLSKQFTAAAVALLILDGKLTLETPIATYFPEVTHFHSDLRIKHLVYFTSGLPDYTTLRRQNGLPWFSYYYFTTDEAIAATLSAPSLEFAPGTMWEYSNVNYMILTRIVEQASGMPFAVFVQRRIFTPLDRKCLPQAASSDEPDPAGDLPKTEVAGPGDLPSNAKGDQGCAGRAGADTEASAGRFESSESTDPDPRLAPGNRAADLLLANTETALRAPGPTQVTPRPTSATATRTARPMEPRRRGWRAGRRFPATNCWDCSVKAEWESFTRCATTGSSGWSL